MITAERYHDISCGHRVVGHENKCRLLHGHNYRIHFSCVARDLDNIGRVIDFSVIKSVLCEWLEKNWDHKFLIWTEDPIILSLSTLVCKHELDMNLWPTDFNPTAENMAEWLMRCLCPHLLRGTGITVNKVIVEETRKCKATAQLDQNKDVFVAAVPIK